MLWIKHLQAKGIVALGDPLSEVFTPLSKAGAISTPVSDEEMHINRKKPHQHRRSSFD